MNRLRSSTILIVKRGPWGLQTVVISRFLLHRFKPGHFISAAWGAGILAPLPWPPPPRCRAAVQEIWQAPDIAFCRLQCGSEGNLPSYTARRVHLPVPQGAERGSQAVKNIGPGPLCPVQGPHRAGAVLRAGVSRFLPRGRPAHPVPHRQLSPEPPQREYRPRADMSTGSLGQVLPAAGDYFFQVSP